MEKVFHIYAREHQRTVAACAFFKDGIKVHASQTPSELNYVGRVHINVQFDDSIPKVTQKEKRIEREFQEAMTYSQNILICTPVVGWIRNNRIFSAKILVPDGVNEGIHSLQVEIPEDHPFKPPKIHFTSNTISHSCVSNAGGICINTLREDWSPCLTLSQVLLSIVSLVAEPCDHGSWKDKEDHCSTSNIIIRKKPEIIALENQLFLLDYQRRVLESNLESLVNPKDDVVCEVRNGIETGVRTDKESQYSTDNNNNNNYNNNNNNNNNNNHRHHHRHHHHKSSQPFIYL